LNELNEQMVATARRRGGRRRFHRRESPIASAAAREQVADGSPLKKQQPIPPWRERL
jgi:hypothetical protein